MKKSLLLSCLLIPLSMTAFGQERANQSNASSNPADTFDPSAGQFYNWGVVPNNSPIRGQNLNKISNPQRWEQLEEQHFDEQRQEAQQDASAASDEW